MHTENSILNCLFFPHKYTGVDPVQGPKKVLGHLACSSCISKMLIKQHPERTNKKLSIVKKKKKKKHIKQGVYYNMIKK